jgi:PIN domain nuclease of toxin-antitoxin system
MNKVVLDASALLALIKDEPGGNVVVRLLGNIVMSSVNVSEVASTLLDSAMSLEECRDVIEPFVDSIIPFDAEQSFTIACLKKSTKHKGLSLGDRACIGLGLLLDLPVYTADKIWAELKIPNVKINLIR